MAGVMTTLTALEAEFQRIASAYTGKCTFALTDLTSGEHISRDEDDAMPTASLIKVPILVAAYQAARDGAFDMTDRISYRDDQKVLGSGVLQHLLPASRCGCATPPR